MGSVCAIGASRWAAAMPAVVSDTWRSRSRNAAALRL